jgi:serine/threonine protein kinase/tetratricopeptide (TPR) repeat protein
VKPAPSLDDVADAILDGTAVDWPSVESRSDGIETPLVDQLKALAKLRLVSKREGGEHWGPLRVFERIGQGAFGDVYRAWDTRLDREVALKLLPIGPPKGGHYEEASSIIEEGRLLARVRHPNVVTIYGAERIGGRVGLWMELVNGRTLEEALRDGTTFSAKDVERIGVELCRAVAAVHAAGLLHRDIKAQNVMLADDGRLVLMDFGTGREFDRMADGSVSGTPLYLAPEVLTGSGTTARSDVYSVGVVLYHLLTGSYPVQARDLAALRRAHSARTAATLPDESRRIPPRLRRVIGRALDPDPDRRYATADLFGAALSAVGRAPILRTVNLLIAVAALIVIGLVAWGSRDSLLTKSAAHENATAVASIVNPVIAVMPFKNLSAEPDSDYFADGLTSEVIRNLNEGGLNVKSQTSSFDFKNKPRDLRSIGELLNVNHIVEADVLRVGNRLRINAQLVQVAGDVTIWSRQFDQPLEDVFAIQDQISRAIVNKLQVTLAREQRRYQTNLQAYQLYLRARAVSAGETAEGSEEAAVKLFKEVIRIDPTFAPAYAGLAGVYTAITWNVGVPATWLELRPAARKALELDPDLAETQVAMGLVYTLDRDWDNAVKSFERSLTLNPNLTQIHSAYSDTLVLMGQPDKALQLLGQALVMDPLSRTVRRDLGLVQFLNGRFEDAIASFRRVRNFRGTTLLETRALMMAGRPEDAIALWKSRPNTWERWLARAYVMTGRQKDFDRLVAENRRETSDLTSYHRALIYAGAGDKDRTLEALERTADLRPDRAAPILLSPEMKFLVGEPRYNALKKRLGLP